jgi:hypothetical protein
VSRYFVLPETGIGPGGDIVFRKHNDISYLVYVGDQMLGQVSKLRYSGWWGTSYNRKRSEFFNIRQMEGFATRFHAASFIIKHHGYWMHDERFRMQNFPEIFQED